ncbi:multicopper oxidase [Hortaea werneckii]|nr:multicopper oxidase [Hortaea werneckii]
MRRTLQLAALAAGGLAAPSNEQHFRQGLLPKRDAYLSSAVTTTTNVNTIYTTIEDTVATVYETVDVTKTLCPSSTETKQYASSSDAIDGGAAPQEAGQRSSFGASAASPTSTTTSICSDDASSATAAQYNNGSPDTHNAAVSTSGISTLASLLSLATMSPTISSAMLPTTTAIASTMTSGVISHTAAANGLYTCSTTISAASTVPSCSMLPTAPITNEEQVGDSVLGSLCAPYLDKWLGDYETAPWGELTTSNSDSTVQGDVPVTNVTRAYDFTISRGRISADGVLRDVILINNQFPGPMIEANWGDRIEVTVHNNITEPQEGTSLHWHGQLQRLTPWQDGVPSIGQCPIAPGHSFTYNFLAEVHGSSWYHAHYSSQFTAGVAGPLVVHGPTSMDYDIDIGPVMLSDWYHIPYFSIVENAVGTDLSVIPPTSDAVLINGRGRFDCSKRSYDNASQWLGSNLESDLEWTCVDEAPLAAFRFQSGKVHRLRLMNHGANGVHKFSIDNHNLTVIATDYVPVVPYTTDVVTLGVGQRADVLVTALDTPEAAIWMRTSAPGGEPCGGSDNPDMKAAIYYENADVTVDPKSETTHSYNASACLNADFADVTPAYAITPSNNTYLQDLDLTLVRNETGNFEFRVNGQVYHANFNKPLLKNVQEGNFTFEPQWNVYDNLGGPGTTSVILNVTNNMPLTHPFHLHGHNFYVLNVQEGSGPAQAQRPGPNNGPGFEDGLAWDGSVKNFANPMRRDTILLPPYGFAAIQFELDNPGIWPFHCHVAWHLSGGQSINILYRPDDIPTLPEGFTEETCKDWAYYSSQNVVDQIDAGA